MPRLLVLFIVLLLPLQFAWAAAAAYCQHETGQHETSARPAHFGHHEHVHQAGGGKAGDAGGPAHADCHTCQAAASPLIAEASPLAMVSLPSVRPARPGSQRLASALARAPDRPQWPRLA